MLYIGTTSSVRPSAVLVEIMGDGKKHVRLADHIEDYEMDGQTLYQYDEVVFELEAGRAETEADIQASFDDWWAYGSQEDEPEMTLEERVAAIEDYLIGGGI